MQEEYEALKADIAERGVLVPIEYDEDGNILDGHHRVRACQELGIKEWPSIVRIGLSEDEKAEHVLKLNVHRRHLPKEWRQQKAEELRRQGWSYRRIAKVLGMPKSTLCDWLGDEVSEVGHVNNPSTITGADGKQYPARRHKKAEVNWFLTIPALECPYCGHAKWSKKWLDDMGWPKKIECNNCHEEFTYDKSAFDLEESYDKEDDMLIEKPEPKPYVVVDKPRDIERVIKAVGIAGKAIPAKRVELKRLERIAREAKRLAIEETDAGVDTNIQLYHCDFHELKVEAETVNLIFTDPPYPKEYLHLWSELGKFAADVLKPGALLVTYTPQYWLPEILEQLKKYLQYVWIGALYQPGAHNLVHPYHIRAVSKPLLFLSKGNYVPRNWFEDAFFSESRQKELHEWQQSLGPAMYFIERITLPGQLVVDPFLGAGTTALAAKKLGRRFIGCDIDANAVAMAKRRLADAI